MYDHYVDGQNVPGKPVPDCGTDGTPPCPPPNVFFETRAFVIDRLAGPGAPWGRRRIITAQVDTYLQAALQSTFILLQGLQGQGADRTAPGVGPEAPRAPDVEHAKRCGCGCTG
jgi:hypothetical protein